MKKHLFGVALVMCLTVIGGFAGAQTIDDIQYYNPETGDPQSPSYEEQVTITGRVYVEKGKFNGGTQYIQDTSGSGIYFFDYNAEAYALGTEVTVTGEVSYHYGEINIGSPTVTPTDSEVIPVSPTAKTVGDIIGDYENIGSYLSTTGTICYKSGSNFRVAADGDTLRCYVDPDTNIDLDNMEIGDFYYVAGACSPYNAIVQLKPAYAGDIIENPGGDTSPIPTDLVLEEWVRLSDQDITANVNIVDDNGIVSADLYYRDSDGVTPGSWSSVGMTNTSGETWSGVIPAPHSMSQVDYYVVVSDGVNDPVSLPGAAPVTFVTVAVGITSIYDMQYVDPAAEDQSCAFNDKPLNIRGVVTAGTGEVGDNTSRFIVQEMDPNNSTDSYAFGGVLVYLGSGVGEPLYRGDYVEIGGVASEYNGITEMIPHNANAITILDFGYDLPTAPKLAAHVLADGDPLTNGGAWGEAWESVWVKTFSSAVVDTNGLADSGRYELSSVNSVGLDSLRVDPYEELIYQPTLGDIITVEGFMMDYNGLYLIPLSDEYIIQTGMVAVDDTPTITKAGGFRSIAPNPFNPSTEINFVVNRDQRVQLNVYNIRGEMVRSMVNESLPASEYSLTWNGTNDAGATLSSGTYFARLRIGTEVMQVRKMTLVK